MKHAKKYPAPQISEAVFRGAKSQYNFEVYPINVRFNEVPAVYVISRRKIDRNGRAHHFLVCIGQTDSLVEEIKKHKRGRCVKHLRADTVSVILEDDERKRFEVESDLKSAHAIPCHHNSGDFVSKEIEKTLSLKAKPEIKQIVIRAPKKEIQPKPARTKISTKTTDFLRPEKAIEKQPPAVKDKSKKTGKVIAPIKAERKPLGARAEKVLEAKKSFSRKSGGQTQKKESPKAEKTALKTEKTKFVKKIEKSKPEKTAPANSKVVIQALPKPAPVKKKVARVKIETKAKSSPRTLKTAPKPVKVKSGADAARSAKSKPTKIVRQQPTAKSPKVSVSKTRPKPDGKPKLTVKDAKAVQIKSKAVRKIKTPAPDQNAKPQKNASPSKQARKAAPRAKVKAPTQKTAAPSPAGRKKAQTKTPRAGKVTANTKNKLVIKEIAKGGTNRSAKTSPRKRLAF